MAAKGTFFLTLSWFKLRERSNIIWSWGRELLKPSV